MVGAVVLLVLVSAALPASAASTTKVPPYWGATYYHSYTSQALGCSSIAVGKGAWYPHSGKMTVAGSASARTCTHGAYGGGGASNEANWIYVTLPFRVAPSGSHSVVAAISLKMSTLLTIAYGACPPKTVNYHPPSNAISTGYCTAGAEVQLEAESYMSDLTDPSWYNYNSTPSSYGVADLRTTFDNQTTCSNPYGQGATCTNNTYATGLLSNVYGQGDPGYSKISWNGITNFSLWANGSGMIHADRFTLTIAVGFYLLDAYANDYNFRGAWVASAKSSANIGTLGNGAVLTSLNIL
jgi:hypothetical protein